MTAGAQDIAVVGRGLMGTACARHLAREGLNVTLIGPDEPPDPRRFAGPFASHHDAGRLTRILSTDADWARLGAASIARYRNLEEATGVPFYRACGALVATQSTRVANDIGIVADALGAEHSRLEAQSLQDRFGMLRFVENTVAAFDPVGGWINPRHMRAAMERDAQARGATVKAEAAVALNGGTITLASGDVLRAEHVVLATGGYTGIDGLLAPPPIMNTFARTVFLAEITEETAADLADMPGLLFMGEGGAHDVYIIPPVRYPDGRIRIKIGGEDDSAPLRDVADVTAWFHRGGAADAADTLKAQLAALMPDLSLDRGSRGACIITHTAHGLPYIDRASEQITVLTGGCGAAAKSADEIGRLGAVMALTGDISGEGYSGSFTLTRDRATR